MTDSMTELSAQDERLLRRSIEVSASAVANGNMPFGAIMADPDGNVLLEAENTGITGRNDLNHAETVLMNMAVTILAPEQIATATLYTSCEPCAMCAGAMYWYNYVESLLHTGHCRLRPSSQLAACLPYL